MNLKPPRLNLVFWDGKTPLDAQISSYLESTGLPVTRVKTIEELANFNHIALITSVDMPCGELAADIWCFICIQPTHASAGPFEDPFVSDLDPFEANPFEENPFDSGSLPVPDFMEGNPFDWTILPPPGPPQVPTITDRFRAAEHVYFPEASLFQNDLTLHLHCLHQGLPLKPLIQHQYSEQPAETILHSFSRVKPRAHLERDKYSCKPCQDFAALETVVKEADIVTLGFGSESSDWIRPTGKFSSNGYTEALQSAASPIRSLLICPDTDRMQSFLKRLSSLNLSVIAIKDPHAVPKITVTLQPSLILADLSPGLDEWSLAFFSINPDPRNFVDISNWLELPPEQFSLRILIEISKTEQQLDAVEYRKNSTNARRDRVESQALRTFLRTQSTEERAITRTRWKRFCQVLKDERATHFQRDWNSDWQLEISDNLYKYNRTQQTFSCHGPNESWELPNIVNSATYTNQGAIAIHLFHSPLHLLPPEHYHISRVGALADLELTQ